MSSFSYDYEITHAGILALKTGYLMTSNVRTQVRVRMRQLLWLAYPPELCAIRAPDGTTQRVGRAVTLAQDYPGTPEQYAAEFKRAIGRGWITRRE